jgi:hypothetical protein
MIALTLAAQSTSASSIIGAFVESRW